MDFWRRLLGRGPRRSVGRTSTCEEPWAPARFRVGWATDIGQVRQRNEDAVFVLQVEQEGGHSLEPLGLFVLADGMGGHRLGDVASALASRVVARHVIEEVLVPALMGQERGADRPALTEVLVDAVNRANSAVAATVPGGGTTLTCALLLGYRAYLAHVGDSRAYVVLEDHMEQITRDHSLVDRLVELGQLTHAQAANHPQRNVLYRAVGQRGELEVDTYTRAIPPGGSLLLCSDGLWGAVDEEAIFTMVRGAASPQAACDALVRAANDAGGRDNITAILVEPPRQE